MLSDIGRGRGRIGAMVPSTNRNLEPDFFLLAPPGVSVHFVRLCEERPDQLPTSDVLQRYAHLPVKEPAELLAAATVEVIAYGCTSATLSGSPEFDARLSAEIEQVSGLPTITAASALLGGLAALGVSKLLWLSLRERAARTRYQVSERFGSRGGFRSRPGRDLGNYEQEMNPSAVYDLGRRADHPDAQALVLSCTEMRAVEAIDALERDLEKPVVTSNQALMFACLNRIGVNPAGLGVGGRLFELGLREAQIFIARRAYAFGGEGRSRSRTPIAS